MGRYNKSPISLREGHVYMDGLEVMDAVKCEIKFTPDVWTGRALGELTPSSRWLGYSITGTISRRRNTPLLAQKIKEYKESHVTPEFTIQGLMDDKNSDYYAEYGTDLVTCVGCVFTGDILLTLLDASGDVVEDSITFAAKDVV